MDFSAVSGIFDKILKFLPTSPFITFINKMQDLPYLGYLNYFLPISQIIAIGLFYAYQIILRWIKAIE